ncbi:MAG: F0F1 ATP synthase subunit B [Flavobacteriaceae bacterium]|jgi:F-type H+-transporting ATPase subunit b|nr:F0F1 ATP synthase subunit B [Flavobacteriaceae bacterium]MDG1686983.1 F0F1 ATP synthase subunit B [Flavobacteriaceae bacterium]MDG2235850.1 F0F1 ATP synthase subunit B [Flavobacteriaceae bacterium]|tara:strand:- start:543 stop:1043 length:501 start_codon:yes stop_codon:yes gene_type:complete
MEKLISEFSLGLFFWQTLIFVGLIFLLKKYAWKPILSAVNEREASIKDALEAAKEARSEMESLQSDNQRILKEARAQKEALLKEARTIRSEMINTAKVEAQSEANKILSQAQEAIQNEKRTAVNELKDHVSSIALDIATKVLQNELESKDKQMQLVSKLLQDSDMK